MPRPWAFPGTLNSACGDRAPFWIHSTKNGCETTHIWKKNPGRLGGWGRPVNSNARRSPVSPASPPGARDRGLGWRRGGYRSVRQNDICCSSNSARAMAAASFWAFAASYRRMASTASCPAKNQSVTFQKPVIHFPPLRGRPLWPMNDAK